MSAQGELENLLHFLYQCPVGLVETDNAGSVRQINPAAVRMLGAVLDGDDLTRIFPLLDRLDPGLAAAIREHPERMGALATSRRVLIRGEPGGEPRYEMLLARVGLDRVMLVLVDISAERRLALREHELVTELRQSMFGRIDPAAGLTLGSVHRLPEGSGLGGDWYDLIEAAGPSRCGAVNDGTGSGAVWLVLGEVPGATLRAAAAMGQLRSAVRGMAPLCPGPEQLLIHAERFAADVPGAAGATMICAALDRVRGRLSYAGAGHPPPLLLRASGEVGFLTGSTGTALGQAGSPRQAAQEHLAAGDLLVVYTAGLVPGAGPGEGAGLERLRSAASALAGREPADLCERLAAELVDGAHDTRAVRILAVRWDPPGDAAPRVSGGDVGEVRPPGG